MPKKKADEIIREMTEEELQWFADIPVEVAKEFLLELYNIVKPSLVGKDSLSRRRSESLPGISNLCKITGTGNRTIQEIIDTKTYSVGVDVMDSICLNAPFSLNEVTDYTKEWATENNKEWPHDYMGHAAKRRLIKAIYG